MMTLLKKTIVAQCSTLSTVVICRLEEPIILVQLYKTKSQKKKSWSGTTPLQERMPQKIKLIGPRRSNPARCTKNGKYDSWKQCVGTQQCVKVTLKTFWWQNIALAWIYMVRRLFTQRRVYQTEGGGKWKRKRLKNARSRCSRPGHFRVGICNCFQSEERWRHSGMWRQLPPKHSKWERERERAAPPLEWMRPIFTWESKNISHSKC